MIVLKYTDPSRASTDDAVARALQEELAIRGISGQPGERREAAAKFAVTIAQRNLKLLRSNTTWDWRGHTLAAILRKAGKGNETDAPGFNQLSLPERVLFAKYFLEADGALLCALTNTIARTGEATRDQLLDQFEDIITRIFDSYEQLATSFREKTQLKNRLREAARRTKGDSRQRSTIVHKVLPHLQALVDLGLLVMSGDGSVFRPITYAGSTSIAPLAAYADRLDELEQLFGDNPYGLISSTYALNSTPISADTHWADLRQAILDAYHVLRDGTTGLAYIPAVVDWCCTVLLSETRELVSPAEVRRAIDLWYERDPTAVRFHVDFGGEKAYLILAVPESAGSASRPSSGPEPEGGI
jgi:hypothetical protein